MKPSKEDDVSTHELYDIFIKLPVKEQHEIGNKVQRIMAIVNEGGDSGRIAFGIAGLELTNVCTVEVKQKGLVN